MTILGLEKILLKSFASWEPIFLKDTKVVVDGSDLVGYLHDNFSTALYGGENLLFYMAIRSFFLNLKYSNVEPYFILRGCCPVNDNGVKFRQKRISASLSQIATASKLNAPDLMPLLLSLSAMDVFQDALDEFNWKRVRVKSFPTVICSAVAKILQCPVIGLSSDYFALMSKNQNILFNNLTSQPSFNPTYLTLRLSNVNLRSVNGLSENSNTKLNTNDERMLLFHKFIPKHSVLAKISDFHMPLFVTLLGTDTVQSLRLPLELQKKLRALDLTPYNERRLSLLFQWFSQFQLNSIKPLEDVINCYSDKQHASVIQSIIHSISRFICPLEETRML
uniref:SJCHGC05410 protein n=1 Tax=Schistosoma japonicum TaxID=6182 RepID=Q5DEQ8_SCHJA|nr:SJCHGC05410 protein [Schistosoma japonicum]